VSGLTGDLTIGLAVGRGTGPEIAAVFEEVFSALGARHGARLTTTRSPRTYHSYVSLRREAPGADAVRAATELDADHYESFCRGLADRGVPAVFRTAINAQSLYLVRERLRAIKADLIAAPDGELLLIRDQAQGFYTGENTHAPGVVERATVFSRAVTDELIAFALERARAQWPDGGPDEVIMAYKFHLLDGALEEWVRAAADRHGTRIALCQPDTVNRNLIERGFAPRTLVIGGNEWGDIMHAVLLDRFASERQETRYTENHCLDPALAGLVEYQTVHGSADDLEGRGTVNPTAAIRAAAAIAQRHAGCAGAVDEVERALAGLGARGVATPDAGGRHTTTGMVRELLAALDRRPEPAAVNR
jgi:isocitrate/isopropylmalate dehydrogenase